MAGARGVAGRAQGDPPERGVPWWGVSQDGNRRVEWGVVVLYEENGKVASWAKGVCGRALSNQIGDNMALTRNG